MDDCDPEPESLGVRGRPASGERVLGHDHGVAVVGNLKITSMSYNVKNWSTKSFKDYKSKHWVLILIVGGKSISKGSDFRSRLFEITVITRYKEGRIRVVEAQQGKTFESNHSTPEPTLSWM